MADKPALSQWQYHNLGKLVRKHGIANVMNGLYQIALGQAEYWRGYNSVTDNSDFTKVIAWEEVAKRLGETRDWRGDL